MTPWQLRTSSVHLGGAALEDASSNSSNLMTLLSLMQRPQHPVGQCVAAPRVEEVVANLRRA